MLYHCKVCMHLFKVALGQILNNFPLFTCHFFPPVFKEVLVKDVFAGVVMIKHLCIKWCHLENNTTFSNSGPLSSVLLVSTAVTGHMSKNCTPTHYMAESTSGQDEVSSVFWLAWLTKLVQSRKLDIQLDSQENWTLPLFFSTLLVNLCSRTGEQKKWQILCDKWDTNFIWKNLPQTSSSFKQISFCKRPKQINSWVKITTEHESNSPVMFVTHKHFAILFFLPSCCINAILLTQNAI